MFGELRDPIGPDIARVDLLAAKLGQPDDQCAKVAAAGIECRLSHEPPRVDMEFFGEPKFAGEKERRVELFQPYQLNRELLADLDLKILHCLPAHHGYEIEGALLHDERSLIFTQAENRLHSQKAVMLKLAGALS